MDQENELLEISGTVENIIFKNEENGYTVLRLKSDSDEMLTVVGCFPYAAPGESMIVSGQWTNHSVHGRQFKAEFTQRLLPTTAESIYRFLAGGSVKGVGPATASLIVSRFGDKTLDVMLNSWQQLEEIRGISQAKAQQIHKSFQSQAGIRMLMEFMCSYGLSPILAMRMYKYYGDQAMSYLRGNPYIICKDIIGASFAEADAMALQLGIAEHSKDRIEAAIFYVMGQNADNGHCFVPREKLVEVTANVIDVEYESVEDCINELILLGKLEFEYIADRNACYLPELYEDENYLARRFADMSGRRMNDRVDVDRLLSVLERNQGIKYADMQRKALELAAKNQFLAITGGPGTGKTTCIRAILALYEQLGLKTLLTAPTGRAAKRMTELTGKEASTIHRLLGAKFSEDVNRVIFTKNESELLDCDAVILDESSMVDIGLMDALVRALPPQARLVMVGDVDQLPPVGPGNVFSALLRSEVMPVVRLTEIFRQTENSRIIYNAHMINRGEYPRLGENQDGFYRLRRLQADSALDTIAQLFSVRLPGKLNISPEEIQVLSPRRKGELGTVNINRRLQEVLNPAGIDKSEKQFGDAIFREGDRVMQIRNNYDIMWKNYQSGESGTGIYNGDIGRVVNINNEAETITVDFDGRVAVFGFESLGELEHAWAITVHKSQGSEYRAVILAISSGSPLLLTRGVLYTAVTRAKEYIIIVGDDQVVYQMIDNVQQSKRYTALRIRLRRQCGLE